MEKSLPKGWVTIKMGEIYHFIGGGTPSKSNSKFWNGNIPWASIKDISKSETLKGTQDFISEDGLKYSSANVAEIGEVIMGTRMLPGKAVITSIRTSINQDLKIVRSKVNTPNMFTYYQFRFLRGVIEQLSFGTTVKGVTIEKLREIDLLLPPLAEQERIVAKLDKLFAQHEKIKKALDRIPQLLKAFRQQVLTQAVTGKLTEQWREGKELEDFDQLVCRIINNRNEEYQKSIALAQQKGERKPSKAFLFEKPTIDEIQIKLPQTWGQTNIHFLAYVTKLAGFEYTNHFKVTENGDIPIVRAQNVQMGKFEDKNRLYISKEVSDFLVRSQLHGRELLMVFIGAGTGNVCLAPDNERWHLAPNVAKIDFDFVDRKYMFYYLQSDLGVKNVLSRVKATAQPSLSMETIREIVTIVPPIDEQQEIVRRVESLFAKADAIEARYQTLKAKIDNLPQAILHKAFKGELVPQLPTDGDAKDLLAEIMALKEEVKGRKKK